jgi:hypothetical protein
MPASEIRGTTCNREAGILGALRGVIVLPRLRPADEKNLVINHPEPEGREVFP